MSVTLPQIPVIRSAKIYSELDQGCLNSLGWDQIGRQLPGVGCFERGGVEKIVS